MKISFDFDDTLTHIDVQNCARKLMSDGHTIYILTARYGDNESNSWGADWNDDLKELAADLNIPKDRWLFAGISSKSRLASLHGIELHLDDAADWVREVKTVCKAMQFNEHASEDSIERFMLMVDPI